MANNQTVDSEITTLTTRQEALKSYIGNKPITLAGKQYTGSSLASMCESLIEADKAVEAAYRAWRDGVAKRDALRVESAPVFSALKSNVQATYGKSSQVVAQFGYKPAEETVKSVEVKAAAVVKLRATRTARHTMGAKQRQSVKGSTQASPSLVPAARSASQG